MLLESIKDITKDGRIVVKDADYSGRTLYVFKLGSTVKGKLHNDRTVFPVVSLPTKEEINKWAKENNFSEVRFMDSKDSQYTKSEYTEMLARLQRQLQQAKSLGDTEEAKELQKEIDDLKALESGVQDSTLETYGRANISYEGDDIVARTFKGELISRKKQSDDYKKDVEALKKKIDIYFSKDSDTEAKITDLTEKAKAARAQGYAADQYEAEIEKLKAQDKKTKDEEFRPGDKVKTKGSFASTTGITGRVIKKVIINFASGPQDRYIIKMDEGGEREIRADELVKDSTKDSPRDNIERQIDELEDELEEATGKKKSDIQAKIKELEKQLESVNDAYDEVDWLTIDPLTEKGKEILASMKKEYGDERGEKIFYASKNAGKITGVDSK